jgi:hypothetical protein
MTRLLSVCEVQTWGWREREREEGKREEKKGIKKGIEKLRDWDRDLEGEKDV